MAEIGLAQVRLNGRKWVEAAVGKEAALARMQLAS
jgi:hypothetical protein